MPKSLAFFRHKDRQPVFFLGMTFFIYYFFLCGIAVICFVWHFFGGRVLGMRKMKELTSIFFFSFASYFFGNCWLGIHIRFRFDYAVWQRQYSFWCLGIGESKGEGGIVSHLGWCTERDVIFFSPSSVVDLCQKGWGKRERWSGFQLPTPSAGESAAWGKRGDCVLQVDAYWWWSEGFRK